MSVKPSTVSTSESTVSTSESTVESWGKLHLGWTSLHLDESLNLLTISETLREVFISTLRSHR